MSSNPRSEIPHPKLNWLRGKDSNLYLLVQSQPSCRLDDPEVICDFRISICDLLEIDRPTLNPNPHEIENRNSKIANCFWKRRKDSNLQPPRSKRGALIPLSYVSVK